MGTFRTLLGRLLRPSTKSAAQVGGRACTRPILFMQFCHPTESRPRETRKAERERKTEAKDRGQRAETTFGDEMPRDERGQRGGGVKRPPVWQPERRCQSAPIRAAINHFSPLWISGQSVGRFCAHCVSVCARSWCDDNNNKNNNKNENTLAHSKHAIRMDEWELVHNKRASCRLAWAHNGNKINMHKGNWTEIKLFKFIDVRRLVNRRLLEPPMLPLWPSWGDGQSLAS